MNSNERKMKEIGIIVETKGETAKVAIQRHSACGDCGACHMSKEKSTMETIAKKFYWC